MLIFTIPDKHISDLIPNPPKYVGGFADRLKGLLFVCEIAEELGQTLGIYWNDPIAWTTIIRSHAGIQPISAGEMRGILAKGAKKIDLIDSENKPDLSTFMTPDDCYIFANQIFGLRTKEDRFRHLRETFHKHFSFSGAVQDGANEIQSSLRIDDASKCVAIHFRAGGYIGSPWPDPYIDSRTNIDIAMRVAISRFPEFESIVVFSDSAPTTHWVINKKRPSNDTFRIIATSQKEKFHFERSKTQSAEDALFTLSEFALLGRFRVIVLGEGEFGLAAAAAGTTESLFYYPNGMRLGQSLQRNFRNRAGRSSYKLLRKLFKPRKK